MPAPHLRFQLAGDAADFLQRFSLVEANQLEMQNDIAKMQNTILDIQTQLGNLQPSDNLQSAILDIETRLDNLQLSDTAAKGSVCETPGGSRETATKTLKLRFPSSLSSLSRTSRIERHSKDFLEYRFQPSIWDAATFLGTPAFGRGASCQLLVLVFISMFMQIVFAGILLFNMATQTDFEAQARAARIWRIYEGHHAKNFDPLSGSSLIARVCGGDSALSIGIERRSQYQQLGEWVGNMESGWIFSGTPLCLVAMTCWMLMVLAEIHRIYNLFSVVRVLCTGQIVIRTTGEGALVKYELESLSKSHLALSVGIVFLRGAEAIALSICGCLFLTATTELTDLVLNAIAVEVVLHLDTLLFAALAPDVTKEFIKRLKPAKRNPFPSFLGLDLYAAMRLLSWFAGLCAVYSLLLSPQLHTMKTVYDSLCGGDLDFVWRQDVVQHAHMARTTPFKDSRAHLRVARASWSRPRKDLEGRSRTAMGGGPSFLPLPCLPVLPSGSSLGSLSIHQTASVIFSSFGDPKYNGARQIRALDRPRL
eukprot:TRINITY_DN4900_c1_g2_i2.p1 TRINITY_DN4900_c1_g2~~TRINITY_DN4900_c1_g2_i2.p1  ORF type:complete len:536 (-),score=43.01 TRINITY_DN4900_c1_g2_i2:23-1630(-)